MTDQGTDPSVAQLLRTLREDSSHPREGIQVEDTTWIREISDRMASIMEVDAPKPKAEAVLSTLSQQASRAEPAVRLIEVGTVQHIGNSVATLSGLRHAATDDLVNFPTGVQGLILNLDSHQVDVILLGSEEGIQGGDLVTTDGQQLRVPVGAGLLGRIVNPLGQPLDGREPAEASTLRSLERRAPGITERAPVNEPLHTGLKIVDALIPIGRGQRELIVGDRQTGKTAIAVDTILNQRDTEVACVYVAIGQKKSSTLSVIETLRQSGALAYTTVVISSPDDPPALRYLAPYAGATIAEFLTENGRDTLVVFDDLTKHADAYRELSLLLRRPPGREAYPGDIFYLHARLLERACKLNEALGGGSMTALPIVETQRGNISAYIPTNLISITDGQIALDSDLFNSDIRPAVNIGESVSRVGGAAQTAAMNTVAGRLRLELSQYEEVARFARFGAEVDEATRRQIRRGERVRAALTQPPNAPIPLAEQIIILLAATEGYLDEVPREKVNAFEQALREHVGHTHPGILQHTGRTGELTDESQETLIETIADFHSDWLALSAATLNAVMEEA